MKNGSNEIYSNIRKSPNLILKSGMQSFHIDHGSRTSFYLNQAKRAKGKPFWNT